MIRFENTPPAGVPGDFARDDEWQRAVRDAVLAPGRTWARPIFPAPRDIHLLSPYPIPEMPLAAPSVARTDASKSDGDRTIVDVALVTAGETAPHPIPAPHPQAAADGQPSIPSPDAGGAKTAMPRTSPERVHGW